MAYTMDDFLFDFVRDHLHGHPLDALMALWALDRHVAHYSDEELKRQFDRYNAEHPPPRPRRPKAAAKKRRKR